jgi:hypothetical protein
MVCSARLRQPGLLPCAPGPECPGGQDPDRPRPVRGRDQLSAASATTCRSKGVRRCVPEYGSMCPRRPQVGASVPSTSIMVSTRFSTPLWRLRWWRSVCSEPGRGLGTIRQRPLARPGGCGTVITHACPPTRPSRPDHRDPTAALGDLRTELREQRREIHRLRVENEVLREAAQPLIHHAPARERFAFVHRLRARFGVRRLCRILVTDHSNYHAWVRAKARRDERGIDAGVARMDHGDPQRAPGLRGRAGHP